MATVRREAWLVISGFLLLQIMGHHLAAVYAPRNIFCIPGGRLKIDREYAQRKAVALREVLNGPQFGTTNLFSPGHGRWVEVQSYTFPAGLRLSTFAAGRAQGTQTEEEIVLPFMVEDELQLCLRAGVLALIQCPPETVEGYVYVFDVSRAYPPVMIVDPNFCPDPQAIQKARCFLGFSEELKENFLNTAFSCPIPGCYVNYPHATFTI